MKTVAVNCKHITGLCVIIKEGRDVIVTVCQSNSERCLQTIFPGEPILLKVLKGPELIDLSNMDPLLQWFFF